MAKRLVCVAASFGYGPVSKLLAIAKALKTLGHELCFVGYESALELAKHFPFDKVLALEDIDSQYHDGLEQELRAADGVVNVLRPQFGVLAQQMSLPHFYVDSLFWMWTRLDARVVNADLYFIQDFPGVREKVDQWRGSIRNPQIVGPIVDLCDNQLSHKANPSGSTLVINFGGLESRLVTASQDLAYPYILTSLLLPILNTVASRYEGIIFTGNHRVMVRLDQQFPKRPPNIHFVHLPHEAFIELLKSSRYLITSPGLTTTYEAFLLNVPARFLPPQNYSQTLMLDFYRQAGLADFALHWKDLYSEYDVGPGLDVSTAVGTILSAISRFNKDLPAQEQAAEILKHIVNEPLDPEVCRRQIEFAKSMGSPASKDIAGRIDVYLKIGV